MENKLFKHNRSRRGAFSSVMFLFTCLGLLLIGSIGIDASHAFYARRQLQNAADNAALTGAFYLTNLAPNAADKKRSESCARQIAGRCVVDGTYVVDDGDSTVLSYNAILKPMVGPQVCHIAITRNVPTSLARLVGIQYMPVSAEASAGAYIFSRSVMPNWINNLAISYKAQTGQLNLDVKDKNNNGWFITEWKGQSSPEVDFGVTNVSNGEGNLQNLQKGVAYNVAIVRGGKKDEPMPKGSEIIGTTSIVIKEIQSPHKATITLMPGQLVKGHPGVWPVGGKVTSDDLQFARFNGQWTVALIQ